MSKPGLEWKAIRIIGVALVVTVLSSFWGVTPAYAQGCPNGLAQDGSCLCPLPDGVDAADGYAAKLRAAAASYTFLARANAKEVMRESIEYDISNNIRGVRGDILQTYCLQSIVDSYGSIVDILTRSSGVSSEVDQFISALESSLTSGTCGIASNGASSLINGMCIAMPTIEFDVQSLPTSSSCASGRDADSYVNIPAGTVFSYEDAPASYKTYPASRWVSPDGRY